MFSKLKVVAVLLLVLHLLIINSAYAQDRVDDVAWLSQSIRFPFADKWRLDIRPIVRITDGISRLNNVSFDYSLNYSLDKRINFIILSRTFFFPDRGPRRFIFLDAVHKLKKEEWRLTFTSLIRLHYAFDTNNTVDPDFIRFDQGVKYKLGNKFSSFVAVEAWMKLNDKFEIGQARYKLGGTYQIRKKSSLNLQYWRQQSYNAEFSRLDHMIVFTIIHILQD